MEFVYLLWHTRLDEMLPNGEDVKLIGVYSSRENAQKAQTRVELLNGFRDHLEGFEISCNVIDKDEWSSGFISVS